VARSAWVGFMMLVLLLFPAAWPFLLVALVLWGLVRLFRWSWVAGLLVVVAAPFVMRAVAHFVTSGGSF
jgi:hypothetical protein